MKHLIRKFRRKRYVVSKISRHIFGGVHYYGGNQYYHDIEDLKLFKRKRKAIKFLEHVRNEPHFFSIQFKISKFILNKGAMKKCH